MKKLILLNAVLLLLLVPCFASFAGEFIAVSGEIYLKDNGKYAKDEWISIDRDGDGLYEWYYFNDFGFKGVNYIQNGYQLNELGQWVVNGVIQYDLTKSTAAISTIANNANLNTNPTTINNTTSQTTNTIISNRSSSAETNANLYNNMDSKSGVQLHEIKSVQGKTWVNVIAMDGNDSYFRANSGKYNCLTMEAGINSPKDTATYTLSIYVNGEFLDSVEDFDSTPDQLEFFFDPNSTITIIYMVKAESGSYLSSDNKTLYIRNAKFSNKQEK